MCKDLFVLVVIEISVCLWNMCYGLFCCVPNRILTDS